MGRLLITLLLCERGVLRQPALYLSWFLNRHRQEYYTGLQGVQERGDWEGWLAFFLSGVAESAGDAATTALRIQEMRDSHRQLVVEHFGASAINAFRVLEALCRDPIVSVTKVRELIGLTMAPANRMVARLAELGLLVEITGQKRNRQFLYEPYVLLVDDPSPGE